jgi:uncharacterized protein
MNNIFRKPSQFFFVFFTVLWTPSVLMAASFDCKRAGTQVEKIICAQADISKLDEDLSGLYKQALVVSPEIKNEQLLWIKERNSCKSDQCVRDQYTNRIGNLRALLLQSAKNENNLVATPTNPPATASARPSNPNSADLPFNPTELAAMMGPTHVAFCSLAGLHLSGNIRKNNDMRQKANVDLERNIRTTGNVYLRLSGFLPKDKVESESFKAKSFIESTEFNKLAQFNLKECEVQEVRLLKSKGWGEDFK